MTGLSSELAVGNAAGLSPHVPMENLAYWLQDAFANRLNYISFALGGIMANPSDTLDSTIQRVKTGLNEDVDRVAQYLPEGEARIHLCALKKFVTKSPLNTMGKIQAVLAARTLWHEEFVS